MVSCSALSSRTALTPALHRLEDYLQTWPSTLFVVSHDRAFLDAVATDIIHQHNERLDYYKGALSCSFSLVSSANVAAFPQVTSSSSTPPNRSVRSNRNASTRLSFSTVNISRPSSTDGAVRLLAAVIPLSLTKSDHPYRQRQPSRSGPIEDQDPGEVARAHAARGRRCGYVQIHRDRENFATVAAALRGGFRVHQGQAAAQGCQHRRELGFATRSHRRQRSRKIDHVS